MRGVLGLELRIERPERQCHRGDRERQSRHRGETQNHHERGDFEQRVGQAGENQAEDEQRHRPHPVLGPQQGPQVERR